MIWRKILVKSDSSIADLHYTLQMSFGWSNTYLHCFTIRANEYGIAYSGGICFDGNADSILLDSFDFDVGETFVYEYNFNDDWELQIRLEKVSEIDLNGTYPRCIGGNRAGHLEDCSGVESYMEHAENYGGEMALPTLANFLDEFKPGDDFDDLRDLVVKLQYWVNIDTFDRKKLNLLLAKYANNDPSWEEYMEEGFVL